MEIIFKDVSYFYNFQTSMESLGIKNINLTIKDKSYTAIIGKTGSGKSTLLRHLNGILKPTYGQVKIGNQIINSKTKEKKLYNIRKKIGVVFQFPEKQLFESTIGKDIAIGPINFGMNIKDALDMAHRALSFVGLSDDLFEVSPFDISEGQMRLVAIAGILVMNPDVLVLDEPTVGLDNNAHNTIMNLIHKLHNKGTTVVLVSHDIEDIAKYADYVVVMKNNQILRQGNKEDILTDVHFLNSNHILPPKSVNFANVLEQKYFYFSKLPLTVNDLAKKITECIKKKDDDF